MPTRLRQRRVSSEGRKKPHPGLGEAQNGLINLSLELCHFDSDNGAFIALVAMLAA